MMRQPLGQAEKMTIQAYKDSKCAEEDKLGEPYAFQINPSSYNYNYKLEYVEEEAAGSSGSPLKYYRQVPNEWNFEILIDGTGVIPQSEPLDVVETVERLKEIVLDYNGKIHRNPFLKISWGAKSIYKGTLESLELDYKLFKPNGTPLRVIAKLSLKEWIDPERRIREENAQSPDITHERIFVGDDRIDFMCEKIYDSSDYYIDLAKANNLNSFRRIKTGQRLQFPPLK